MAALSDTPVFVFAADYHESGRLAHACFVRLYDPTGVAAKILHAEDTAASEDALLRTLAQIFTYNVRRMAGWKSHHTVMPKLLQRCFRRAVPFPWYYKDRFGPRYRYSDAEHLDLYDFFSEYGVSYGVKLLTEAYALVSDSNIDLETSNCCLRALVCAVLAARADLVTGRINAQTHELTLSALLGAAKASLDLALPTEDAFGIEVDGYWRTDVVPAYTTFIASFHG